MAMDILENTLATNVYEPIGILMSKTIHFVGNDQHKLESMW